MIKAFKIYNYRILIGSIGIWILLLFIPNGFISDYFQLETAISKGVVSKIILSFTSFFSFLVTVLILVYNTLREKFRRLTLKEFLENKYSSFLVSSFISTFIINIISAIYIDSHPFSHTSLNLSYYALIFSISYFIFSLPIAFISISYTDSQNLIEKYLNLLRIDNFPQPRSHELTITHNESNPLIVLSNLARTYIEKEDYHSITKVIFSSQIRIKQLIGTSQDRLIIGRYLSGQRLIWDNIIQKAFQKKEFNIVNNIFLANSLYHYHFSQNKIPLLYLEELKYFIESIVERLVKENLSENIEQVVLIYEKILEYHYENSCPPESKLKDLNRFFNKTQENKQGFTMPTSHETIYINIQWEKIHSDIPYIFSIILSQAIENKSKIIFDRTLNSYLHLIQVAYISNLGNYQKAWIIKIFLDELHYYQIKALEKGLIDDILKIKTIDYGLVLTNIIDDNFFYKKEIFVSISAFILELYELGRLDLQKLTLLGGVGRHCSNMYLLGDTYKETLMYIIKVIQTLKLLFEEDLKTHSTNYNILKEEVTSFIEFHKSPTITSSKPNMVSEEKKLDEVLMNILKKLENEFRNIEFVESIKKVEWN